jgi:hypothetical protein
MSKKPCCSYEQNQSRPHPPHPTVLRQGGFYKIYRVVKNILQNPLTQHRWMWRVWSRLILLMEAPMLLAHKIRSLFSVLIRRAGKKPWAACTIDRSSNTFGRMPRSIRSGTSSRTVRLCATQAPSARPWPCRPVNRMHCSRTTRVE